MFKISALVALGLLSCATIASAGAINVGDIDGVKGSEWSAGDQIGTLDSGTVNVYAQQDSTYIYVAYEYTGLESAKNFDGVNHYIDSFQDGGVYGDGDDVIIEGGNYHWAFGLNGPPWATTPTNFATLGTGQYGDTTNGVYEGYLSGGDFAEFAIKKSILNFNSYPTIEIGGQAWTYPFDFIEIAPSAINTVAVPLPASAYSGLALLSLLALPSARRRLQSHSA
ncbi:MAG TPA: hypothetical protein VFE58_15125 [Tepidisphaeraceae bacterium]|jgi:hypothetical protein|nr:hypothetical protein [Tepidisphaeraceae bacterium]